MILQIGIPTMILLCLTWVYYHYKFFVPASIKKTAADKKQGKDGGDATKQDAAAAEQQQQDNMAQLAQIDEEEEEGRDQEGDEDKPEEKKDLKLQIYITVAGYLQRMSERIIIAASLSLGGALILVEGLLFIYLAAITADQRVEAEAAFNLAIFLYFFIPTVVLVGIPIIARNKNHAGKMFWMPLLAIFVLLFITMPVSAFLIHRGHNTSPIGNYLVLAPTLVTIFWLTVSYIGRRWKKTKFGLISFIFICFVFPLVVLQPLIGIDAFDAAGVAQGFSALLLA